MTTKDMLKITINLVVIYVIGGLILALVYSIASPIMYKKGEEEKQVKLKEIMPEATERVGPWYTLTEKSLNDLKEEIKSSEIIEKLATLKDTTLAEKDFLNKIEVQVGKETLDKYKKVIMDKSADWKPHNKRAEYYIAKKGDEELGYIVEGYGKGYSSYINFLVSVDKNFTVKKVNILHHAETPGLGDEIEKDYFLKRFENKTVETLVVIKGETQDKVEAISGATISSRAVTEDGVRNGVKMLIEKFSGKGKEQHVPHS